MALTRSLRALKRRLHAETFRLLEEEVARLGTENEELRQRAACAEDSAEFWHDQATGMHEQLAEACGGKRGMTMDGHLVVAAAQEGLHA